MSDSEYKIINGNKTLIVSFGGKALKFGGILPFEFLRYLSSMYSNQCDLYFFIDKHQCSYHNGIKDITNNIDETVLYLDNMIKNGNYNKVIFIGVSAGGYAAILFGSLCSNINNVIAFVPQTILNNKPIYSDLKNVINKNTKYILYGNIKDTNIKSSHHISHCKNLECFSNVKIIEGETDNIKILRDNGFLKKLLDSIIID